MTSFYQLPNDIQRYILQFIPLWQRLGLASPPEWPPKPYKYYRRVRQRPSGMKWDASNPNIFSYHRRGDVFGWKLFTDYWVDDYYYIECRYASEIFPQDQLKSIHRTGFYRQDIPTIAEFVRAYIATFHSWHHPVIPVLKIELKVKRLDEWSLPTRQACTEMVCEYMMKLSKNAEKMI